MCKTSSKVKKGGGGGVKTHFKEPAADRICDTIWLMFYFKFSIRFLEISKQKTDIYKLVVNKLQRRNKCTCDM